MVDIEAPEAPVAARTAARLGPVRPFPTPPRPSGAGLAAVQSSPVPSQHATAADRSAELVKLKLPHRGRRSRLRWPLMLEPLLFALALAATLLALNNYLNQGVMAPPGAPSAQPAPGMANLAAANPR